METDIQSYLKVYHNRIPDSMCDSILSQITVTPWAQHNFYDYSADQRHTHDRDLSVSETIVLEYAELMNIIWHSLKEYTENLQFPWFNGWNGFTSIRWNKYEVGTIMREHCDHINAMFDGERKGIPTLTILGMLNDNYKGGELVMFGDKIIECKKGDLLVFPSNFLYPHRIDPVIEGTRFSFVSWVW